jgi:type III secretion protein T
LSQDGVKGVDFFATISQLSDRLDAYLAAAGLVMARMTGVIIVMPAFTRLGLTGILRGAIAFTFALPLVPMAVPALAGKPVMMMAALLPKEVAIGLMIGVVLGVPIWAAEAAGDILDFQRGSSLASLADPSAADEASITGTLLSLVMIALYFGFGGLPLTLRTVYESYQIWPIVNLLPALSPATGDFFLALLDNLVVMGLVLVAPIAIFMLLDDLLLALVSRAAPTVNVFALSLSMNNLIFLVLLALYAAFLLKYMGNDLSSLLHAGNDIEKLAK